MIFNINGVYIEIEVELKLFTHTLIGIFKIYTSSPNYMKNGESF